MDHVLIPDKPWLRLPLPVILEHPFITGEILNASLWGKYQQMIGLFQKLAHYSYLIETSGSIPAERIQEVSTALSEFRLAMNVYSSANGDVDRLITWCNTQMRTFFGNAPLV